MNKIIKNITMAIAFFAPWLLMLAATIFLAGCSALQLQSASESLAIIGAGYVGGGGNATIVATSFWAGHHPVLFTVIIITAMIVVGTLVFLKWIKK